MRLLYSRPSAAVGIGCGRAPDTEENVRKALDQANMQVVQVEVDDDANIVHLKGTVETSGDRTRAEEVASAAVGTTGRVLNELTVKGLNDETADDLDDDIDDALDRTVDNDPVLKERDIEFDVANGMVTINGEVRVGRREDAGRTTGEGGAGRERRRQWPRNQGELS